MESRVNNTIEKEIINVVAKIAGEDLFVTKTIDELLWGYDDPIFAAVHKIMPSVPAQFSLQVSTSSYSSYLDTGHRLSFCEKLAGRVMVMADLSS